MAFVKLDCGILDSTIWIDLPARNVFLTALLMAEPKEFTAPIPQYKVDCLETTDFSAPPGWYGFVPASGLGIIRRAEVDRESGIEALKSLGSPEAESRSAEFEGRRMIRCDGGYLILNYQKYREKDHTAAERSKRYRERKQSRRDSDALRRDITQAEAEAEAEAEKNLNPLGKTGPSANDLEPQDAARALIELLGISGYTALAARDAIGSVKRRKPEMRYIDMPEFVVALWREVSTQPKRALPSVKTFLNEIGQYIESDHWRAAKKPEFKPEIDWQGGHIDESGVYINKHGKKVPGFICPPKPKQMAGD